jgi:hypothetical protein
MTAASLFNQLKAGKISKEQFLYEVRRDQNLPFISPITTFKEAIKILQNRGIVTEVFEMGPAEGDKQCQCGGSYEPHEDAGEMVCASCGEREPLGEDNDTLTKGAYRADKLASDVLGEDPEDKEEYDPFYDREEEINYGIDDEDRETGDDMEGNREEDYVGEDEGYGDDELEDIIAKQDAEKQGQEDVLAQFDMGESEEPSLREQVQEFVKNAMKGGSSMDEAKDAAREYFNKKESLNEAAKPKLSVDQVNPYELRTGIEIEMGYAQKAAPSWAEASLMNIAGDYAKAQAKALKNLAKDPAYYSNQIAGKHKEKKAPVVKADGYVKSPKSKMEKSNVKTTLSKTERAKGNPQGVKIMKEEVSPIASQWKVGTQFKNLKNSQVTTIKKFDELGNVIITTDAMPGKEWTWPAEELSNMIKRGELELIKVQKEGYYDDIAGYNSKSDNGTGFKDNDRVKSKSTGQEGAVYDTLQSADGKKLVVVKFEKNGQKVIAKYGDDFSDINDLEKLQAENNISRIREMVKAQLKKEAKLVKSATTGATIDVLPDAQAQKAQSELQKKGVKTTSVAV